MKKITNAFMLVALCAFCFVACKKSEKTTSEKIQGVWKVHTMIYNEHYDGEDHLQTATDVPGMTVEFRNDGKAYTIVPGEKDTVSYSLSGDTKLIMDDESYDIKSLTSNALELYGKEVNSDGYDETTLKLSR